MLKLTALPLLAVGLMTGAAAQAQNVFDYPQTDDAPASFHVVNEIPAGSFTKYEIDAEHGQLIVDRYVSMPVRYPANYGSITGSAGGDGDPLDALVITRDAVYPGAVIKVKAIGVLRMVDDGEADDKIIAVPADDVDPTYAEIDEMDDLPSMERERLNAFFRVYKDLPDGGNIELNGFGDAAEAREILAEALTAYANARQ
ncbi:inorganic diphosphatase [Halomonas urumqiensis]|uniref:Inorganic pyrophosphatase n=1 Tax=Halomonas urumqiensis TaxID=1684789 RepID=A0A2N7UH69_9GAMM|nr:inorganic diphosphatase [Halomonas urumqiensis]PMR79760.1 pyrophosphatase [Halomonas urumqiensis]PTB00963.1 inorganic diphosphatase [Halomonas urumqiensis]GHE23014.1 inorganic pyrophosphatase [Halomonas urumqiensis]